MCNALSDWVCVGGQVCSTADQFYELDKDILNPMESELQLTFGVLALHL